MADKILISRAEEIDDAVSKRHSHTNASILNSTEESYTTVEKNKLLGIANGAGERLVGFMTLDGNAEYQPFSIAWNTAIVTFSSPHGLTENLNVNVFPNNWTHHDPIINIMAIPIEWVQMNAQLHLEPIDDTTAYLKTSGDQLAIVDDGDVSNSNINAVNFHFETKTSLFSFLDLNEMKKMHVRIEGYEGFGYRYMNLDFIDSNDTPFTQNNALPYLQTINCTFGGRQSTYTQTDIIIDCFGGSARVKYENRHATRRSGYSIYYDDVYAEDAIHRIRGAEGRTYPIRGITGIRQYTNVAYSFLANGSNIFVFDSGIDIT